MATCVRLTVIDYNLHALVFVYSKEVEHFLEANFALLQIFSLANLVISI